MVQEFRYWCLLFRGSLLGDQIQFTALNITFLWIISKLDAYPQFSLWPYQHPAFTGMSNRYVKLYMLNLTFNPPHHFSSPYLINLYK